MPIRPRAMTVGFMGNSQAENPGMWGPRGSPGTMLKPLVWMGTQRSRKAVEPFANCSRKQTDTTSGKDRGWVCNSRQKYPEQK